MILKALRRDQKGATIVEFAMVLPVLSILLLGTLDLGYRSYATSIVQGSLHDAARMATIGNVPTATIENFVTTRLRDFSRDATITTATRSYSDFNGVAVPETITSDTAPVGSYNSGDCYQDFNGNGRYDLDRGRNGVGGSEDVVYFEVTMRYPHIVPIANFLGSNWSNDVVITQNTVLRNQPYAGRNVVTPTVLCA
jgi:Flp pilus assembly protein TadG